MTLNELLHKVVRPSIFDADILPSVGDEISFVCPSGLVIDGALVEKVEYFCNGWNVYVSYETTNCVKRFVQMSGWVCMSEVLS
jgi:hypothetical protein